MSWSTSITPPSDPQAEPYPSKVESVELYLICPATGDPALCAVEPTGTLNPSVLLMSTIPVPLGVSVKFPFEFVVDTSFPLIVTLSTLRTSIFELPSVNMALFAVNVPFVWSSKSV